MEGKTFYLRTGVVAALVGAMLLTFFALLYHDQIVDGLDEKTATALNTNSTQVSTSAARGLITDRNGALLVGNQTEYEVELSLTDMGDRAAQRDTVLRLLEICQLTGVTWTDSELPITAEAPYTFTTEDVYSYTDSESGEQVSTRLGKLCQAMKWEQPSSAEGLLDQFVSEFELQALDRAKQRSVAGVLYSCLLRQQEILWTDYRFASDVDITFISHVEEEDLPGVTIAATSVRRYDTAYAAHLLGRVGLITAENWTQGENYKEQGYQMDDTVGLSGVEYAFEQYLRGTDGVRTITTNRSGDVISTEETQPALAGGDVALTLDLTLQEAAEDALATLVPEINGGEGGAAAVVLDVRDGGVLACASWPTYDLSTMTYDESVQDLSPLFNRALQGTYSPGSTYKMVTATAGLETGVITPTSIINCTGYMDYYGTVFRCWIYRETGTTHGAETVSDALRDSCNIFFYNVGVEVGIETLTDYARAYGLGVSTGVELTEATGVNAGPEYSESVGAVWYGGNTLSAAIGQSDNLFTPLQIAQYIATLVNGGTRYAAHLLQSVTAADGTVTTYEPQILGTVELDGANLAAIKEGMLKMAENSTTVSKAFANLNAAGIRVGAKTGSAQVSGQENANGLFVCFAPYDDPQIAICVAVEKGGSGAATAVIAAQILEAYFGVEPVSQEGDAVDETATTETEDAAEGDQDNAIPDGEDSQNVPQDADGEGDGETGTTTGDFD
jgi:penicillin-binding protein 2